MAKTRPTLITYLIGAGASKNAHPVVNEFPKELRDFSESVSAVNSVSKTSGMSSTITGNLLSAKNGLVTDINWVVDELSNFASVDTFAKTLFVTKKKHDLAKLKLILGLFLSHREISGKRDSRYNSFFASIIQEDWKVLPHNIRVVSWNYDYQFEYAFSRFSGEPAARTCHFFPVVDRFAKVPHQISGFSLFKVNGSASLMHGNEDFIPSTSKLDPGSDVMYDLLSKYGHSNNAIYPVPGTVKTNPPSSRMCYAWEEGGVDIPAIRSAIQGTTILVVIGYSFPFFNRVVDKQILEALNPHVVYLQDPFPDGPRERLEVICPKWKDRIVVKKNGDQFLVPNEL